MTHVRSRAAFSSSISLRGRALPAKIELRRCGSVGVPSRSGRAGLTPRPVTSTPILVCILGRRVPPFCLAHPRRRPCRAASAIGKACRFGAALERHVGLSYRANFGHPLARRQSDCIPILASPPQSRRLVPSQITLCGGECTLIDGRPLATLALTPASRPSHLFQPCPREARCECLVNSHDHTGPYCRPQ